VIFRFFVFFLKSYTGSIKKLQLLTGSTDSAVMEKAKQLALTVVKAFLS